MIRPLITNPVAKAAGWLGAYIAWVLLFRLLALSLITYFLRPWNARFQDISETYGSNELVIMGLGALVFTLMLRWLDPRPGHGAGELFTPHRFEKRFAPGFTGGAVMASGVVTAFLISGLYRYWGFFIQPDEGLIATLGVVLRIAAIGCLAYCEEYIFRFRLISHIRKKTGDAYAILVTAAAFCFVKALQFDVGIMHLITLMLVSLAAGIRSSADGDFARGAGLWAGILVVFHPLLSLPVLGIEYQGILLVKYATADKTIQDGSWARLLTGGAGGPLSSMALQLLLIIDVTQGAFKNKKTLFKRPEVRLR
ncbi:MAG: hypothetical protein A2583_16120 [Bdellovibrionales bacterium RIFOXYD1_FULL_53_11]|nr:MAG: hypothetical protein A2583_16120 [Bdellovibrionales bacterium RIFOXYD1_FULL_53_11]